MKKVVIIGGVATGMKTASRLRRRDPNVEITVLERGPEVSYGACGFPYYIGGDVKNYASFTSGPHGERDTDFFAKVKGVKVLTNHEALAINRNEHTVTYLNKETGETKVLLYDKLVLGTGATPTKLTIPGSDLGGIYNFWVPNDVRAVKTAMEEYRISDVVIVGAGLIGIELAEAFYKLGLKVSIVEMQDRLLPQMLDKELADLLLKPLRSAGVNVYLNEKTLAFVGETRVTEVKTSVRSIKAQLVIVAVGVKPNIDLAVAAGLQIGSSGCIAVNEYLQTSDADIYAGGDCAECTNLVSGAKVFAPMGSTANKHGRVIADNLAGDKSVYLGNLGTSICKIINWQAGSTGLNEQSAAKIGMEVISAVVPGFDRLGYMPGANRLILKLFAEKKTGLVVGAQAVGTGGVDKRIDTIAALVTMKANLRVLSNLDVGYAPPFNGPIDNIATAANVLTNKLVGYFRGINPKDFQVLKTDPEYTLVDVRTPLEYATNRIAGCANIINIPLPELRDKANTLLPDKQSKLVCSCQIDLRGYEAEVILRNLGYNEVRSLEGGMSAWPYETENDKT